MAKINAQFRSLKLATTAMLVTCGSTALANQGDRPPISIAELQELHQKAKSARIDAEAALKKAQEAEDAVTKALAANNVTTTPNEIPNSLARMDCYAGAAFISPSCQNFILKMGHDITYYAAYDPKNINNNDYRNSSERALVKYINNLEGKVYDSNRDDRRKLSFVSGSEPITSRFSTSGSGKTADLKFAIPLPRRRVSADKSNAKQRVISDSLILGASASFDGDDKKYGLIRSDSKFNDNPLNVSLTFTRSYHKALSLHGKPEKPGKETSFAARGMNFADTLIKQCKAAMSAPDSAFGLAPARPCQWTPSFTS
ncbi:MAG: hypothetical protein ACOVQ0_00200 [Novosphingobium sp.]|uniref:hypothetical protein n=1 Tax=Novosphingobium sp. TaxID=1874826 RepID=UPI003B9B9916